MRSCSAFCRVRRLAVLRFRRRTSRDRRPVALRLLLLRDVDPQGGQIERPLDPKGQTERSTTLGEVETLDRGVQVRSTTGCCAGWIGYDGPSGTAVDHHDAQQIGFGCPSTTPHTHAYGTRARLDIRRWTTHLG